VASAQEFQVKRRFIQFKEHLMGYLYEHTNDWGGLHYASFGTNPFENLEDFK
jgi:hypothetical protein